MPHLEETNVLTQLSAGAEVDAFLGNVVKIAIVTRDHKRTMDGLLKVGIGPWRVYTFSPENTKNQTYHGEPTEFVLKVCFAKSGNMVWELMEAVSGPTIFADFLEKHGEGTHHVAYDCNNTPFEESITELKRCGFKRVQSENCLEVNHFAFFGSEADITTVFETYAFPSDWDYPEPEAWYPARA